MFLILTRQFFFSIDKNVTEDILKSASKRINITSDALRFKYYQKTNQWHQEYQERTSESIFATVI
jgi:hypothetical protein